jgi:hypothetical protein
MTWDTPSWREAAADYHEAPSGPASYGSLALVVGLLEARVTKNGAQVKLYSRPGNEFTRRFPLSTPHPGSGHSSCRPGLGY